MGSLACRYGSWPIHMSSHHPEPAARYLMVLVRILYLVFKGGLGFNIVFASLACVLPCLFCHTEVFS